MCVSLSAECMRFTHHSFHKHKRRPNMVPNRPRTRRPGASTAPRMCSTGPTVWPVCKSVCVWDVPHLLWTCSVCGSRTHRPLNSGPSDLLIKNILEANPTGCIQALTRSPPGNALPILPTPQQALPDPGSVFLSQRHHPSREILSGEPSVSPPFSAFHAMDIPQASLLGPLTLAPSRHYLVAQPCLVVTWLSEPTWCLASSYSD